MTDEELAVIEARWREIGSLTWRDAESPGALREKTYALMADNKGDVPTLLDEVRRLREVERRHDALYAHFADVHAALGEHDDKTLTAAGSIRAMRAEIARLRALVVDACRAKPWMHIDSNGTCPWCNGDQTLLPTHTNGCPAFTPDGDLR